MREHSNYDRFRTLLRGIDLPAAVVDLDAVDHNLAVLTQAMQGSGMTVRVASKSVRHPWLLRYLLSHGGSTLRGLMTYSAREAAFLADQGFDDFLMGYPVGREEDARVVAALSAGGTIITATVDAIDQIELLSRAAQALKTTIRVCLDVDVSWRLLGGRVHLGVRRSPLRDTAAAQRIARACQKFPGIALHAVLAYEAQVAGIPDQSRFSRRLDPIRQVIKRGSRPYVQKLRSAVVKALASDGHTIDLVNGGGTGSVRWTSTDKSVTEVTLGSGFLCSHLFDGYADLDLNPAAFFAIPVVRRSDSDHVTCAAGGYLASGAIDADRHPIVHAPQGLTPLGLEGWGEVQTPFKLGPEAPSLALGDPVICRHAKAGELAERFNEYVLVRSGEVVGVEPTYRGHGQFFM